MQAIDTEGLVLRAFEDRDAPAFTAAVRESVDTVGRWMPWCNAAYSELDALQWFEACRSAAVAGTGYEFGVFSADSSEFLGGAGLNSVNLQHRFCNLGYWVREAKQRQGVARRCVKALSLHAFGVLGMNRVEIVVAVGNFPSEGVAKSVNALPECIARNRLYLHGVSVSATVFSLVPPLPTS